MSVNYTMLSRRARWCIGVVAGVITQYILRIGLWQMFLGLEGEWPRRGGPSCLFIMDRVDNITQNIQLVSSLLYSYWLFTPE